MQLLALQKSVTIYGEDFFGRPAYIKFHPCEKPGWYWLYKPGREPVPISKEIAFCNLRRITLKYARQSLEIYEHIGVLRWLGLDGVVIESSRFPPYHGRAYELWEALKPLCKPNGEKIKWLKPQNPEIGICSEKKRYVEFGFHGRSDLDLQIIIDHPKIGRKECFYSLPGNGIKKILSAPTLGKPACLYYFSKICGLLKIWPHHNCLTWPQAVSNGELLNNIIKHRLADLLGALSLLSNEGLPLGRLVSYCGGHEADINLIKKIRLEQI